MIDRRWVCFKKDTQAFAARLRFQISQRKCFEMCRGASPFHSLTPACSHRTPSPNLCIGKTRSFRLHRSSDGSPVTRSCTRERKNSKKKHRARFFISAQTCSKLGPLLPCKLSRGWSLCVHANYCEDVRKERNASIQNA